MAIRQRKDIVTNTRYVNKHQRRVTNNGHKKINTVIPRLAPCPPGTKPCGTRFYPDSSAPGYGEVWITIGRW